MMPDRSLIQPPPIRPLFRFCISVLGILTVSGAVSFIAVKMPEVGGLSFRLSIGFWSDLLLLPSLLALYLLLMRLLDQRPLGAVGLAFHSRWKRELGLGLLFGAGMILAVGGLERLLGAAKFSLSGQSPGQVASEGLFLLLMLGVSAADEELLFRGYPFQRLVDSGGPVVAVVFVSVLFGLAHLWNPSPDWISTVNTILAGVLFAVCYLRTRSLWLPLGIHFTWNYFQGYVLGFRVSGWAMPAPILVARIHGPVWLTGGAYGPEGSILSAGIILAATLYFLFTRRVYVTPEMRKLALDPPAGGNPGSGVSPQEVIPTGKG